MTKKAKKDFLFTRSNTHQHYRRYGQSLEVKGQRIYVYVAVPGRNQTLFRCVYISIALPGSKRSSAELLLRVGLIYYAG